MNKKISIYGCHFVSFQFIFFSIVPLDGACVVVVFSCCFFRLFIWKNEWMNEWIFWTLWSKEPMKIIKGLADFLYFIFKKKKINHKSYHIRMWMDEANSNLPKKKFHYFHFVGSVFPSIFSFLFFSIGFSSHTQTYNDCVYYTL